jgi:hypothetical protein
MLEARHEVALFEHYRNFVLKHQRNFEMEFSQRVGTVEEQKMWLSLKFSDNNTCTSMLRIPTILRDKMCGFFVVKQREKEVWKIVSEILDE